MKTLAQNFLMKFSAFKHADDLYRQLEEKDAELLRWQSQARDWKVKFDRMWSAWRTLAVETKGKAEMEKLALKLGNKE